MMAAAPLSPAAPTCGGGTTAPRDATCSLPGCTAIEFVEQQVGEELSAIDFLSLITSAVLLQTATGRNALAELGIDGPRAIVDRFEPLRRDDGGYAKSPRSGQASTYHTFLVAACRQTVGAEPGEPGPMIALMRRRQRDDRQTEEFYCSVHLRFPHFMELGSIPGPPRTWRRCFPGGCLVGDCGRLPGHSLHPVPGRRFFSAPRP